MIPRHLAAAGVPAVIAGVDELLQSQGFREIRMAEVKDGRRLWRWDRDRRWALDCVEALHRVHAPENLEISLVARLRLTPERELPMDGATTHFLSGRLLMFEFPLLQAISLRRPERLAARLIAETASALAWFEIYSTPAKCLERLRSPERNGVGIGKPVHAEAMAVLERESSRS